MSDRVFAWIVAALGLALAVALAVQTSRLRALDAEAAKARAAAEGKILVDAGWLKSVEASRDKLAALVPSLRDQLGAAERAKTPVVGTSRWSGATRGTIEIPCPPSTAAPGAGKELGAGLSPLAPGSPTTPTPGVGVTPRVRIEDAVTIDDAGGIYVARKVDVLLTTCPGGRINCTASIPPICSCADGGGFVSPWTPVVPDAPEAPRVDARLAAAWREYLHPRPWREAFVGASLGRDGAGVVGGVSGGGKHFGWWVLGDYVVAEPGASRASGGASIRF